MIQLDSLPGIGFCAPRFISKNFWKTNWIMVVTNILSTSLQVTLTLDFAWIEGRKSGKQLPLEVSLACFLALSHLGEKSADSFSLALGEKES